MPITLQLVLFLGLLVSFSGKTATVREEFTGVTYMDVTETDGHWDVSEGKLKPEVVEDEDGDGDPQDADIDLGKGQDGDCVFATFPNPIDTDVDNTYECISLTILAGETVVVSGSQPLYLKVLGDVIINGTIQANGGNGENAKDVGIIGAFNSAGSPGGAGGFAGGRGKGTQDGEDGDQPGGDSKGRKGEEGGLQASSTHSGGGGGGGHGTGTGGILCPATAGTSGNGGGSGGNAGKDDGEQEKFDSSDLFGGAGGGAGGGANLTWSSAGVFLAGGAGGGGGGALAILAGGNLIIGGTIQVNGGNGGNANGVDVGRGAGAGGGGAGGSLWLHASRNITITGTGTVEARGGTGGTTDFAGHGEGGNGACGLIRMGDSDGAPTISGTVFPPAQMPVDVDGYADAAYSEDSVTFESLAYDLGTAGAPFTHTIPTFSDDTTNGTITYKINASSTSPTTGYIGWKDLTDFALMDGHRWVKWQITIDRNNVDAQADAPPTVDFFQWNFDKGPILGIDTVSNDFGAIVLPATGGTITVTIDNSGDQPATGCSAPTLSGAGSSQFTLSADTCGVNDLAAAGNCTFNVQATPSYPGDHKATLSRTCTVGGTITTNALGLESQVSLPPPPDITAYTINPAEYPQGQAIATNSPTVGGGAAASFAVSPAMPAGLSFNTTNGDITGTPTSATALVNYTVTATNLGGSDNFIVPMEITHPSVSISSSAHDFGTELLNTATSDFTFTFTNSGNGDATGCSAPVLGGTDPGQFNISSDTCGTSNLAKNGGTCTVTLNGFATTVGLKQATLTRTCTNPGATATTADGITMTGSNSKLNVDMASYDFGQETLNGTSDLVTFTYDNSGSANVTGCSASTLSGAQSADYNIVTDNCGASDIVPAGTCTVEVEVTPSGYGVRSATLSKVCTTGGTETISLTSNVPLPAVIQNEFSGEIKGAACGTVAFIDDDSDGPGGGFLLAFALGLLFSLLGRRRHEL